MRALYDICKGELHCKTQNSGTKQPIAALSYATCSKKILAQKIYFFPTVAAYVATGWQRSARNFFYGK